MHASYFKMFFLLCIFCLSGLFLFWAQLLPPGIYPVVYHITDNLPFIGQASRPDLQRFEGHWQFSLTAEHPNSNSYLTCPSVTTTVLVHDGRLSGTAATPGLFLGIMGSTTDDGSFAGMLTAPAEEYIGALNGTIFGTLGQGTWDDDINCSGTWSLTKLSPVVDPVQGKLVSSKGAVMINQGDGPRPAALEENLYVGDEVQVPPGADATVMLGPALKLVTIPANTVYVVPDAGGISPAALKQP